MALRALTNRKGPDNTPSVSPNGKFIAYVVIRKQQTLLAIATELLGSMTGNRYGFSEGFDDYSTARVRLEVSGGEPVGTVHIAVAGPSSHEHRKMFWPSGRALFKLFTTQWALDLLRVFVLRRG